MPSNFVRKPGPRPPAAETGAILKTGGGFRRIALLFPGSYEVGMANLGLAVLYRLLNACPEVAAERVFHPGPESPGRRGPALSRESGRALGDFELILASLPFENDLPNFAAMLERSGIAVWAKERRGPLVIAGGIVPMLNPEPLAPLADGFLLGEAEVVLPPFIQTWLNLDPQKSRSGRLRELALLEGFYAPEFYEPVYDRTGLLRELKPEPGLPARIKAPKYRGPAPGLACSLFQAAGPEFGDMFLMEVGRGCGHACRFCAAGHIYRPPRLGRAEDFQALALSKAQAGQRVGLVSAAVSDLPGVGGLAQAVNRAGGRISVSSLRADSLDEELAAALAAGGQRTVALAPEAGSSRLRRVINKHLEVPEMERAVRCLIRAGILNLRLYFMLGLPGEEPEDLEELCALVRHLRKLMLEESRPWGRLGTMTVGVSCFVPKPWTPLQWAAMPSLGELKKRSRFIRKNLSPEANLKVAAEPPLEAYLQAALSRGDRRLAPLIVEMGRGAGFLPACRALGLDPEFFAARPRSRGEYLPWFTVDHGLRLSYLAEEAERAAEALLSPVCVLGNCNRCGAC